MKKSTMIMLYTGLGCLLVGTIVMLITGTMGGMKKAAELTGSSLVNYCGEGFSWDWNWDDGSYSFVNTSDSTTNVGKASEINKISVNIDAGEVEIEDTDAEDFSVAIESGFNIAYAVEDSTLVIKGDHDSNHHAGKVVIYIPSSASIEEAAFSIGGGTLDAGTLKAGKLNVQVGAGEADLSDITVGQCNLETGAGQINFSDAVIDGNLVAYVGMGEIEMNGTVTGDVDLKCGMGNIYLELSDREEDDFNYNVNCAAGNIEIGDSSYSGMGFKKNIQNNAEHSAVIDCGMGNITLDF